MEENIGDIYLKLLMNNSSVKHISSLAQLPATIWTRKSVPDDIISDVSSMESSKESIISRSDDSVSVMSSSESGDSIESLEDLKEGSVRHIPYGSEQLFETHKTLLDGGILDPEERFKTARNSLTSLDTLSRLVTLQSNYDLDSTWTLALQAVVKLHKSVCVFLSIDYVLRKSQQMEEKLIGDINELFKGIYGSIVTFHTLSCKSISDENDAQISNVFLRMIPYNIDILYSTLLNLLYHIKENKIKMELIFIFERILQTSLLLLCSYSDHPNCFTRICVIESLYNVIISLLPLKLVKCIKNDVFEIVDESLEAEFRNNLIGKMWNEYSTGSFKPSVIILYKLVEKLSHGDNTFGASDVEAKLINSSVTIVGTCIRSGIAKKQYPTYFIGYSDYIDVLSSKNDIKTRDTGNLHLWNKISFWLLMRLEDVNSTVRNYVLKIIRHAISTIYFIEKDRQHILSYVFNSLSDDDTLIESLNVLTSVSHLYPMKDGAVKRIATLTLKGSRKTNRLRTIIALGRCRFTPKGLCLLISLFQSLCTVINENLNAAETYNQLYVNSYISDQDSEITFTRQELPAIVNALESLGKLHKNMKMVQHFIDPPIRYVGKTLCTLPSSVWVPLLWHYITNDSDDGWKMCTNLWFVEAKIRFPSLVNKLDNLNRTLVEEYSNFGEDFVGMKTMNNKIHACITEEFVNDSKKWKMLHKFPVPSTLEHLGRIKPFLNDTISINEGDGVESNMVCNCFDCKMDKIIQLRETNPDLVNMNPENFGQCVKDENKRGNLIGNEDPFIIGIGGFRNKILTEKDPFTTLNYTILPNLNVPYVSDVNSTRIDDVNSFTFPSTLGFHISFRIQCIVSAEEPPMCYILLKIPVIKGISHSSNIIFTVLWKKSRTMESLKIFDGIASHTLHYPYNIIQPTKTKVFCIIQDKNIKEIGEFWIYPKLAG